VTRRICPICNTEFTTTHGFKKYCGDGCATRAHRNQQKEADALRSRQRYFNRGRNNVGMHCQLCGRHLLDHAVTEWCARSVT